MSDLGARGEEAAAAYLERIGYTVAERNWRCSMGELDIVALDGDTVVICEVKTRASSRKGTPLEAVSAAKRARLSKLARAYLSRSGLSDVPVRFDVVGITPLGESRALLKHVRDCFEEV